MKSTRKVVSKAVKAVKEAAKETRRPPKTAREWDFPELPYRSKNWRKIRRAVDKVVSEREAREGHAS